MKLDIEDNDYEKLKNLFNERNYNVSELIKEDCLKNILKENINFPELTKTKIVFDRSENIKGFESLIGMSYDYAMRFLFEYKNKKNIDLPLFESIGLRIDKDPHKILDAFDVEYKKNKLQAIINLSFKLSLNEVEFRSGKKLDYNSYPKSKLNDVFKEIEKVLSLSLPKVKEDFKKIVYNPVFGNNKLKADGDIIIDRTLVDFKVTSSLNDFKSHLEQLILYVILAEGLKKERIYYNIDYIQIYYPRFDIYPKFKVSDLISKEGIQKILNCLP